MSASIEERVIEKLRVLSPEQQQEILNFVEDLARQQTDGESATEPPRMTIWDKIDAIIKRVPPEAWDELPTDGSINVDHYLYGAPKKQ